MTDDTRDDTYDADSTARDPGDLRGRGIRFDPLLPPMTPTSGPASEGGVSSEESDQREAVRELDRAHGRDLTEES